MKMIQKRVGWSRSTIGSSNIGFSRCWTLVYTRYSISGIHDMILIDASKMGHRNLVFSRWKS